MHNYNKVNFGQSGNVTTLPLATISNHNLNYHTSRLCRHVGHFKHRLNYRIQLQNEWEPVWVCGFLTFLHRRNVRNVQTHSKVYTYFSKRVFSSGAVSECQKLKLKYRDLKKRQFYWV